MQVVDIRDPLLVLRRVDSACLSRKIRKVALTKTERRAKAHEYLYREFDPAKNRAGFSDDEPFAADANADCFASEGR